MIGFSKIFASIRRRFGSEYRRSSAVLSFNHDGLEIARVRNERRWLPLWHIAVFLYLALLIRLISIADAGPTAYANRMENLRNGNVLERFVARVMYMDPVSRSIATKVRGTVRKFGEG